MATRTFACPELRFHRVGRTDGSIVIQHTWLKELGGRVLMLLGGGLATGMFLMPLVLLPDELWSIQALFAAIGVPLGLLTIWGTFLAQPVRADLRLAPEVIDVVNGPDQFEGVHALTDVVGLVRAVQPGASDTAGPSPGSQRLGVHLAGAGTLGLARGSPDDIEALLADVRDLLALAGREEVPLWRAAPEAPVLEALDDPAPAGLADKGHRIDVARPSAARRRLAYAFGAAPLVLAVAGLVAAALLAPPTSWHPFAMLADPDALVLGIVGAWLVAAVPASRRMVARVHDLVGKGPHTLTLDDEALVVQGRGREVLEEVPADQILGFHVARFGIHVLTKEGKVRLPAYGLDLDARAWMASRLSMGVPGCPDGSPAGSAPTLDGQRSAG